MLISKNAPGVFNLRGRILNNDTHPKGLFVSHYFSTFAYTICIILPKSTVRINDRYANDFVQNP